MLAAILIELDPCEICDSPLVVGGTRWREGQWKDDLGEPLPCRRFCADHRAFLDAAESADERQMMYTAFGG